MKNFIANIPANLSLPFRLISKVCNFITSLFYFISGVIHKKFKTPLGMRIIATEEQAKALDKSFQELQKLAKLAAQKKQQQSDPTLANHIGNGGKNGPTFH